MKERPDVKGDVGLKLPIWPNPFEIELVSSRHFRLELPNKLGCRSENSIRHVSVALLGFREIDHGFRSPKNCSFICLYFK